MTRPYADLDIECFSNWFEVGITDPISGTEWDFQLLPWHPLDVQSIVTLLQHFTMRTFNGNDYDMLMLVAALSGWDNDQLKMLNDEIIMGQRATPKVWPWQIRQKYRLYLPNYIDHIDIMEVIPGVKIGLKMYGCRAHAVVVQDTPVDFTVPIPLDHIPAEIGYCRNDRKLTALLADGVSERMALRRSLTDKYGVDVRSKSDAQIAEVVVKAEWQRLMKESIDLYNNGGKILCEGGWEITPADPKYPHLVIPHELDRNGVPQVIRRQVVHGHSFKYNMPDYIEFITPQMHEFKRIVEDCVFVVGDKETQWMNPFDDDDPIKSGVNMPDALLGRDIVIGNSSYRVGIGGLHSQESRVSYLSNDTHTLRTADVKSYYPSLILNMKMNPSQLGYLFTDIFSTIYTTRLEAKAALKKLPKGMQEYLEVAAVEGGFKIVLNGTFGKLFNKHSIFYAPELGIQVTISGQLSLLMLIERLVLSGIPVVSANTDGVEMYCPNDRKWICDEIIAWWEKVTALGMDQNDYKRLCSRDVNNYFSEGLDGSVKAKGIFRPSGLNDNKHPDKDIVAEAVILEVTKGIPYENTINNCQDIKKFIVCRSAQGGGTYIQGPEGIGWKFTREANAKGKLNVIGVEGGEYLGKAVRWYMSKDGGRIVTAKGHQVAGAENCRPIMRLTDTVPADLDRTYYCNEAEKMLDAINMLDNIPF